MPHLWKSAPSLPLKMKLSCAQPPPTMANTLGARLRHGGLDLEHLAVEVDRLELAGR